MKRARFLLALLAVLLGCRLGFCREFTWDFATETYPFGMALQGHSAILDGSLVIGNGTNGSPEGMTSREIAEALDPAGDFTVEIKFKLNLAKLDESPDKALMMLLDCKGELWAPADRFDLAANSGFAIGIYRHTSSRLWIPYFFLGYGDSSCSTVANTIEINDEEYHTLTCRYLMRGDVEFYFDGQLNLSNHVPSGNIARPVQPFCIGERNIPSYWCLEGAVAAVRIDMPAPAPLTLAAGPRSVFERTEAMKYTVKVGNQTEKDEAVRVSLTVAERTLESLEIEIPAYSSQDVVFELPGFLRPGNYEVTVSAKAGNDSLTASMTSKIDIVAEENPEAIPVFMWQTGDPKLLAEMGFTAQLWALTDSYAFGDSDSAVSYAILDDNLRHGIRLADLIRLAEHRQLLDRFARIDRQGKPYPRRNLDASNPELHELMTEAVARAATAYGDHPGLTMLMVATEVRDGSQIAFNGTEEAEYLNFSGENIPGNALGREAPPVGEIPDFPTLGNLDPDMPLYRFFRWWWVNGDGWNPLHRLLNETYKNALGERAGQVLSFYDPSMRVPPIFGSAAGLDMLNQWTYSYPHPIKIATAVDEERAMARGNGGQKLMKTIQAIWYRDPPAPPNKEVANPPDWVKEYPEAAYITIAPDHLQESLWCELSRRLDVLSFHGYGSLVEKDDRPWNAYRFTNPEAKMMFKHLMDTFVRPLGPVLKTVPERPMETAVLYTLGSNLFGHPGSWGWTWGPDAEMHQLLQRAQLDPGILFDEDVLAGQLDGLKVLALPNCSIMDQRVIEAIWKFQDTGGIVIGDSELNPLVLPDITINGIGLEEASRLDRELAEIVACRFAADTPEVVTHVRSWKNSDYLFSVNDHRGFGDYVGMYGYVAEVGLPLQCRVALRRSDIRAVYDLMQHREIPFDYSDGKCTWQLDFTTNDGRLNLALPQKIANVTITAPQAAAVGEEISFEVSVLDEDGQPVEAILPIQLTITDDNGQAVTGSDYYAMTDGHKSIRIRSSINDNPGCWTVIARELASGLQASTSLNLTK